MQAPKLIITGRDGILNLFRADHVKEPAEWETVPGALEAVARLNHAGWHVVIATNQSGIGRGMIEMAQVNAIHAHMMKLLAGKGGRIDAVFFCPHVPEDKCACRKPGIGMMKDIAQRYGADLRQVPMLVDTERDLHAALAAGCPPHLILSGRAASASAEEVASWVEQVPGTKVHADLAAFTDYWLRSSAAQAAHTAHSSAEHRSGA